MSKPLVIYHAHCSDGFTAAWVAARALGYAELYPGLFDQRPPYDLARGRDVYIVDFSYPRDQLEELHTVVCGADLASRRRLVVLDHHKTAEANLSGLGYCTFDMNRSGAGLTWDHFHPGKRRPWIVDYVEDRDLWRFSLPDSKALSLRIQIAPHTLETWDELSQRPLDELVREAAGCALYLQHCIEEALRRAYRTHLYYPGHPEPGAPCVCVNAGPAGVSDILHALLERFEDVPAALAWQLGADGKLQCSLRSRPDFDCSVIARALGGGGHAQASGFRLGLETRTARQLLTPDSPTSD